MGATWRDYFRRRTQRQVKLNAINVFSSPALKDSLTGGSSTDLFYAAVPGDLITDKVSGETVVDVG